MNASEEDRVGKSIGTAPESSHALRSLQGATILARTPDPDPDPDPAPDPARKPPHQRPEHPAFWDHRFRCGSTPWDAGGVPPALAEFAETHAERPQTLIPGCGSAYEAAYLDRLGWPVTAIDFSAAAIDVAGQQLKGFGGTLLQADFFSFKPPQSFALIYERAFLCALPRRLWPDYAPRCAQLLTPGGLLAGFFYFGNDPVGPPFAIDLAALETLLAPWFSRIQDRPVADSIGVFAGKERWQVWQRNSQPAPA